MDQDNNREEMLARVERIKQERLQKLIEAGLRNPDGSVTLLVIVEESGFQCGPRNGYETYIKHIFPLDDEEFAKQYTALLNRNTDLPFYLGRADIRMNGPKEHYTDERLRQEGIEPLKD